MIARGPDYYDARYKRIVEVQDNAVWALMHERCKRVAEYVVGDTVLDVACGIGLLADYLDKRDGYIGVDFSPVAIEYARERYGNKAAFVQRDVFQFLKSVGVMFDTVIISEVLEHVAQPTQLYELAARVAKQRIIWTVPRDLPAPSHVWPIWPEQNIDLILSLADGECVVKELFGGESGDRWWIVVQDILSIDTDK